MKIEYTRSALDALRNLPGPLRKAFYKQDGFLLENLQHPSLRAEKFDGSIDLWQARVNRSWRFYFHPVVEPASLRAYQGLAAAGATARAQRLHGVRKAGYCADFAQRNPMFGVR